MTSPDAHLEATGLPAFRGSGAVHVTTIGPPQSGPVPVAAVQGTLALELGPPATVPQHRPGLRSVPGLRAELDAFANRFCAAVVEVIAGDRGPQQLLRCTTAAVYDDLLRRANALRATTGGDQRLRRLRAQVRSVHLFCPSPDAAELSVHVRHGQRSRALAARLEHRQGRWVCVALQFG